MNKKFTLSVLCFCISIVSFAQVDTTEIYNTNKPYGTLDIRLAKPGMYYSIQENITYSFRESSPGVKTNTYMDQTSWDSSPYAQGYLRENWGSTIVFDLNYRLLFPKNYTTTYTEGYPLIVMLHGAGERGNCWVKPTPECHHATTAWRAHSNSPVAPTSNTSLLLNNDHNLLHGGAPHLNARNLAGNRLPNDPTMPTRAFPGFVLVPQNLNGWDFNASGTSSTNIQDLIRLVRLVVKKYKIDPNRIYIHGLSNGGAGVYEAIKRAPWLFAATATMSAIHDSNTSSAAIAPLIETIPIWTFTGGQDNLPTPAQTAGYVKGFRTAGLDVRFTTYPNLGHGTWNTAYAEPDFFSWLLSKNKSNIRVAFNSPNICSTSGTGVKLAFASGFLAYQWERDGQIIPGAISYSYVANVPGVYRARFSRLSSSPTAQQWNKWSEPVTIGEQTPPTPVLEQTGSIVLKDLINSISAKLQAPVGFEHYHWYKNGIEIPNSDVSNYSTAAPCGTNSYPCYQTGTYTVVTEGIDKCRSLPSNPKYVVNGITNGNPPSPASVIAKPTGFAGVATSPSSIRLTWDDVSQNERGYEIWRRRSTDPIGSWIFITLTQEDITLFHDIGLIPNTTYLYKIRAVNNIGRSDYAPGNHYSTPASENLTVTTPIDVSRPNPPQNLTAIATGINTIKLTWQSGDATAINYYVYYGTDSVLIGSTAKTYTLTSPQLLLNTNYTFTVRAVNNSGALSFKSNQAFANTFATGLFYKHSTGAWTSLDDPLIVATWNTPEYTGTIPNFSLGPRTQEDYFNFAFNGFLYITTGGNYLFRTISDDGSRLSLNNTVIVNNNHVNSEQMVTSTLQNLASGAYPIDLKYFEYTLGDSLTVQYKGPDTNGAWIAIPDEALVSGSTLPPVLPDAPTDLSAVGVSMTQIDLTWTYTNGPATFEIYRAMSINGTYELIGSTSATSFSDTNLISNTIYFYKVKTVTSNGASPFSDVAHDATLEDTFAPTQPTNLVITTSSFTNVSLSWDASTDNVSVIGYEVWANGNLHGVANLVGYVANNLSPDIPYSFYVIAFDSEGNKSLASNTIIKGASTVDVYYSKDNGALNQPATWGKLTDGSGAQPISFSNNGQYFIVSNRSTSSLGGAWSIEGTVSKVIVPDGVNLIVDDAFAGRIEVMGSGSLKLDHNQVPNIVFISPTSTIEYSIPTAISNLPYGNLILSGNVNKVFPAGTINVAGSLTVSDGVSLRGATNNGTRLQVGGDIIINGTPASVAPDFGIQLELTNAGTQYITTGGDLYLKGINATGANTNINIISTGAPATLHLGSLSGGGLLLPAGTKLNLGNNNLDLIRSAVINPANETGKIAINDGDVNITSNSNLNSNLHFDAAPANKVNYLGLNLTGIGGVHIKENMSITEAIKIRNGELNSGGYVTLVSNANKTANIQEIEGTGIITGDMTVQRYFAPKGKIYRYFSTSVQGVKVADWQQYFPITGKFTGATTGYSSGVSMFIYHNEIWEAYPAANSNNQAPIARGVGYSAYLRNGNLPMTLQVTGNPYQKNIPFSLDPDPTSATTDGWNLLGNPYASTIVWSETGWIKSGVSSTVAVRDNPSGKFKYFDSITGLGGSGEDDDLEGGKIAPGQAFWVQTFSTSPSLTITEKAKSTEQQTFFRKQNNPVSHITLSLIKGAMKDHAFVAFTDIGTDAFDQKLDAVKRSNEGMFNLSTLSVDRAAVAVAINNMSDNFCSKTVSLNIQDVTAGTYNITFNELESLIGVDKVNLHDNFTNTDLNVTEGSSYAFAVTKDTLTFGPQRFTLTFTRPKINTDLITEGSDVCGNALASVNINKSQPGVMYQLLNPVSGAVLSQTITGTGEKISLTLPAELLQPGINTFNINAGFKGCGTESKLFPANIAFTYTPAPAAKPTQEDVSVCSGTTATLSASGTPASGMYKWYAPNGNQITNTGNLETPPVLDYTEYYVTAITENGCEGTVSLIRITPEIFETPSITLQNDTLFSTGYGLLQWYKDGDEIFGANTAYYIPQGSGSYTVEQKQNACARTSEAYLVTVVDMVTGNDPQDAANSGFTLSVYPNPAQAHNLNVKVTSPIQAEVQIKILDVVGKNHFNGNFQGLEASQGVSIKPAETLTSGIYFIIVNQGKRSFKQKIIIAE